MRRGEAAPTFRGLGARSMFPHTFSTLPESLQALRSPAATPTGVEAASLTTCSASDATQPWDTPCRFHILPGSWNCLWCYPELLFAPPALLILQSCLGLICNGSCVLPTSPGTPSDGECVQGPWGNLSPCGTVWLHSLTSVLTPFNPMP